MVSTLNGEKQSRKLSRTWAIPSACPATPILPASRVCMAILKPIPSFPRRVISAPPGSRQSSKVRVHVEVPRIPNLSSGLPIESPSVGISTRKADMPLCFLVRSEVASTTAASASPALLIQHYGEKRGRVLDKRFSSFTFTP